MSVREFVTESEQETREVAVSLAKKLLPGHVLCLRGELGVGKTVFAQGLCAQLGIREPVSSPTFTLVNEYEGEGCRVFHFDLYRIEEPEELYEIGFEEMISSDAIVLIEWPEQAGELLPSARLDITIERMGENGRRIVMEERTI
ncbi:MAG: tRNA (adenosine(37)-N6)-threonylcarbamoyltransferase complex ATPase subunit type 1 TsaE [Clostridia bacterium]|nr:tRNA (adenosine(37)-N6)-threonylcarbamoyltransferase complex ATPase subunit type 1 TsaE [Clostridia bacterium]